jgi:hypothetical protein
MAGAPDTVLEVLDAGPEEPEGPRALIAPQREIHVDHRPTELVIVRLGPRLYGPFRAKARRNEGLDDGSWRVSLERTSQNKIWQADEATVARASGLVKTGDIRVSLEDAPPSKATLIHPIRYSFIPWHHFEKLRQAGGADIELLTDAEILGRVARDHLKPKAKRQQLQQLLRELDVNLQYVPEVSSKTALATTKRLSEHLAASERLGEDLVEALVASGALDDKIEGLKEKRFKEYVEARAAEAQSRISERVREVQKQHEALSAEVDQLKASLKQERDEKRASVEDEIRELRAKSNAEIEGERRRLDEQRQALDREQETLAKAVSEAAARFGEARRQWRQTQRHAPDLDFASRTVNASPVAATIGRLQIHKFPGNGTKTPTCRGNFPAQIRCTVGFLLRWSSLWRRVPIGRVISSCPWSHARLLSFRQRRNARR